MQEMILFLKACVKKVELCGKMLNKYFLIDVISVTPSDTILPIELQKYSTSKYERIYMLPSLHCKKQLKKNVAYRENPLCLISGWES